MAEKPVDPPTRAKSADGASKPQAEKSKAQKKDAKLKEKIQIDNLPRAEFIDFRLQKFDEFKARRASDAKVTEAPIKITLPDGKVVDGVAGKTTPLDVALGISKGLAEAVVVAQVNDSLYDLHIPLECDCTLALLKFDTEAGKHVFWHSSAHILGEALERFYGCHLTKGPPLADGFYYDVEMGDRRVTQDEYAAIDEIVEKIIAEKQPFEKLSITKQEALEMFQFNKYKLHYINEKVKDGENCSVYKSGTLVDFCPGPHLPHTGKLKAFLTTKSSSSYWQGKADQDSLQRVYGISFPDKKLLKEWQIFQEEAAKRDHRNIGKDQELFFFHPLSPGSAFFLPHGTRLYNTLIGFLRDEYRKRGFTEVVSPNIYNHKLWLTSGHWQNYQDNMFQTEIEKEAFALKPMNCPGHCLMFGHRNRSYKELPLRLADFGVLHRNELSGALTGLTRVRRFQQDDGHIFCAASQVGSEMEGCLHFMQYVYNILGFEFRLELSTRPEKFLGEIAVWDKAEQQLKDTLSKFEADTGRKWTLNPGDGAFYGPKIDVHISDALHRSHQCATIQLDFQLPLRFQLEFAGESDKLETPVMIHRAIFGSVERMLAILIEHTAGKWPFWLSPRQVIVVPVAEAHNKYADQVRQEVHDAGFFADVDVTDKTLQKKIREAQLAQYNYILVVGEKEKEEHAVNVRTRDNVVHGTQSVDQIIDTFRKLAKEFK
eukprot:TRINITY_DN39_c1_g1_i1.p1 TRINITY_DN39_c1_g1~~TRINITY_DN39_c1_g1_i1.p1  ORF type:complete len:712 (-),score=188.47 TRINITY_DN39_c1_g1_i1:190-2325(-)